MKKLFLIIFILLFSVSAFAQAPKVIGVPNLQLPSGPDTLSTGLIDVVGATKIVVAAAIDTGQYNNGVVPKVSLRVGLFDALGDSARVEGATTSSYDVLDSLMQGYTQYTVLEIDSTSNGRTVFFDKIKFEYSSADGDSNLVNVLLRLILGYH